MQSVMQKIDARYKKANVVDVQSGDTVRVHQKVIEGGKTRIQVFEGLVIKVSRKKSLTSTFTVRRIASGVGVEKTYLIHSPNVTKIEVTKRSKVRRNRLNYMRALTGKSARLTGVDFDRRAVNELPVEEVEAPVASGQAAEQPAAEPAGVTEAPKQEATPEVAQSATEAATEAEKTE